MRKAKMSDIETKKVEAPQPVAQQPEERSLSNQAWDIMKSAALGVSGVMAGKAIGEAAVAVVGGGVPKASDAVKTAEAAIIGGVIGGVISGKLEGAVVGGAVGALAGAAAEAAKLGQVKGAVGAGAAAVKEGAGAGVGEAAGKLAQQMAAAGALGLGGILANEVGKANKTEIKDVVKNGVKEVLDTPKEVINRAQNKPIQTVGEVLIFGPIGPVIGTKTEKLIDKYFGK